jgi:protein-S-isoprenylcysteine O-methyltransferase Ste14
MITEDLNSNHVKKHAGREDLTGEHRMGDTIQLILLVIFLVVWILDSFVLGFSNFLIEYIPGYVRLLVGIPVLILATFLARSGIKVVFGKPQENPHVITGGVFSIVRHPIYLSAILFYLGMVCLTLSLASAALLLIIIGFYRFISRYEERLLTERFGHEYREYMKKVPMLFPLKLRPKG